MNEHHSSRRLGRSAGALLGGMAAVVLLSTGTDAVMHAVGVFPPWGQPVSDLSLLLASVYRTIYGIGGSYIVARLAPNRPMAHAMISGFIGLVLATIGTVATWNGGPAYGSRWYPLSLVAGALPCAWAGARLRENLRSRES